MKVKRVLNFLLILMFLSVALGIGIFSYYGNVAYNGNVGFQSLPLVFDPADSSSVYSDVHARITVVDGFVKGLQKDGKGSVAIVIRALSPLPRVKIEGMSSSAVYLLIENINPERYGKSMAGKNFALVKTAVNTIKLNVTVHPGETIKIEPTQSVTEANDKYVILGDNRDGYNTFNEIIQQVNGINPALVIDNGDLVFSGKPNQYRLFDRETESISTTLCTTLGNHDIRRNGRGIYTLLYGPAYYSFDYGETHFIFLDSSRGWAEKQAIPEEQYQWLEKDLQKTSGKNIVVVTHIPPTDPRSGITPNKIPNYIDAVKKGENWAEQKLDNYLDNESMDHGFQDKNEARKFEKLMSTYSVRTVYLSHIHSYFDFTKDGVHYIISGGAGAELLTKNSYFHYLVATIDKSSMVTMVELPSPPNRYITRYLATGQLFAKAMYEENPIAVFFILVGLAFLVLLLIIKIYLVRSTLINKIVKWLLEIVVFAVKQFNVTFGKNKSKTRA